MFSALAGMYMAAKVHLTQTKANMTRHQDKQVSEMIYKNKVNKFDETEKYQKSRLPESGYMTVEEYEAKSRPLTRKEINAKILDKADLPKDKNYVYVPHHKFKLVKYNDPVGSPELSLPRRLQFDRQINAQGIVSGDYTKLIYPAVYYYAEADCVSCDLFMIKLDQKLTNVEKVTHANILNKEPKPLLSTDKSIDVKFIFRTLTPIDFSKDNSKLLIKEKIGHRHDGIWKTNLWVYDFDKQQAKNLTSLREAITHYWNETENIDLNNNRWDIYPMGFDANNDNRVIVCAYAYTGNAPKFLGTWSIDINNQSSKLESVSGSSIPVSVVGLRLSEEHDVTPISELEFDAKYTRKLEKEKAKQEKTDKKLDETNKRLEYKRKINQMNMDTLMKVKQRQEELKKTKVKQKDGITNNVGSEEYAQNAKQEVRAEKEVKVEIKQEDINQALPNLDNILNKFKKDAGISPDTDLDDDIDLDELD